MAHWKLKDLFWISSSDAEEASTASAELHDGRSSAPNEHPPVERMLATLRDVRGVVGSIAVTGPGDVFGSDLPRAFDRAAVDVLAMRLSQLRAALVNANRPMRSAAFRYQGHSLFVSQLDCGLLGVLAEPHTHEPELEMVARLVGQRLNAIVAQR